MTAPVVLAFAAAAPVTAVDAAVAAVPAALATSDTAFAAAWAAPWAGRMVWRERGRRDRAARDAVTGGNSSVSVVNFLRSSVFCRGKAEVSASE